MITASLDMFRSFHTVTEPRQGHVRTHVSRLIITCKLFADLSCEKERKCLTTTLLDAFQICCVVTKPGHSYVVIHVSSLIITCKHFADLDRCHVKKERNV